MVYLNKVKVCVYEISVFWQVAVALPSTVGSGAAEHAFEETLLGLALAGEHLLAQLVEHLGHLIHVIRRGHLTELALKVFGQNFALIATHLTQMHHIHFVGAQLNGCVRL